MNTVISGGIVRETKCYAVKSNGMKIIFEFPAKSVSDERIEKEVKDILKSALYQQLSDKGVSQ